MITLKRLNEVRQVASEERAAKLEKKGFTRIGGAAEEESRPVTKADLEKLGDALLDRLKAESKAVRRRAASPRRNRMDQELVSRIAATAKSDLQLPDEQLPTIERYVKRAISRILVFCGREDFPPPLEDVAAQIVEDMLRADQVAPSENDVASVTRGDTSISYRDKANSLKETVAFVKNYESQLIPFKRMKLPKDCPT